MFTYVSIISIGVFGDHIQYVLVVATPLEIILLGVGLQPSSSQPLKNSMDLFATELCVSSDNIQMGSIQGTDNGRVFMCGKDGHLYEFLYHVSIYRKKQLVRYAI